MRKVTAACLSTSTLGSLGMISQAFTKDGGSYTSNGIVEFIPSEEPTNPVDPTDPANPVDPIDSTDPEGPNLGTNGPLSIDYVSSLDFGAQKIASKDQTYFAVTRKYKTVGATGEIKEGLNYVRVTDNRGAEAGWSSKVKQGGQSESIFGKELIRAAIAFKNGNVVTASDSGKPTDPTTITLNSDGSQSDVMSVVKGNGAGTYLPDWGADATTAAKSIELIVPGPTTKYAGKYVAKLTWMLTDAPGN